MNKYKKYIVGRLETIEKDCAEQGITASEWIERHAAEYCRKHWDNNAESNASAKTNRGNNSRWARRLERVNDN